MESSMDTTVAVQPPVSPSNSANLTTFNHGTLRVFTESVTYKDYKIGCGVCKVGRKGSQCDVFLPADSLSRVHCSILIDNGEHFIMDHGSINKTHRVTHCLRPNVYYELTDGCELFLANLRCVYYHGDGPGGTAADNEDSIEAYNAETDTSASCSPVGLTTTGTSDYPLVSQSSPLPPTSHPATAVTGVDDSGSSTCSEPSPLVRTPIVKNAPDLYEVQQASPPSSPHKTTLSSSSGELSPPLLSTHGRYPLESTVPYDITETTSTAVLDKIALIDEATPTKKPAPTDENAPLKETVSIDKALTSDDSLHMKKSLLHKTALKDKAVPVHACSDAPTEKTLHKDKDTSVDQSVPVKEDQTACAPISQTMPIDQNTSIDTEVDVSQGTRRAGNDDLSPISEELHVTPTVEAIDTQTLVKCNTRRKAITAKRKPAGSRGKTQHSKKGNVAHSAADTGNMLTDDHTTSVSDESPVISHEEERKKQSTPIPVSVASSPARSPSPSPYDPPVSSPDHVKHSPKRATKKKMTKNTKKKADGLASKKANDLGKDSDKAQNFDDKSFPRVMFTGVVDDDGAKAVKEMGGFLVQSASECTHLVTDKVRRTIKFLCCLARGCQIVSTKWLDECRTEGKFISADGYLLRDRAAERQHNFSLSKSIVAARDSPLLSGWKVYLTDNIKPSPVEMSQIITSAGGEVLPEMPSVLSDKLFVVSTADDLSQCESALSAGVPVCSTEIILGGILRQDIDINTHLLETRGKSKRRTAAPTVTTAKRRRKQ